MNNNNNTTYLDKLNEAQREAVEYNDGPSLVIAGAGSGKTRVLVYKLVHLISSGYRPDKLMALTFTNKAAREMRERIFKEVGQAAKYIRMGTFHSVFLSILKQHADLIGYSKDLLIYDTNDSKSAIKNILSSMAITDKEYPIKSVMNEISFAKNQLITPELYNRNSDIQKRNDARGMPLLGKIYARYFYTLRQNNAMDFDDILLYTNILMRDFSDVLSLWQNKIDYLLIDEYQDTNLAQYMIASKLVEGKNKIFVVGDDAQSIYSFRGADISNILDFANKFKDSKVFKLEQNYRSTQNIVNIANALISKNSSQHKKNVFSKAEVGDKIEVYRAINADWEAAWVVDQIYMRSRMEQLNYDSFAVLYRTNAQSRILEQNFRRSGIDFRIYGGMSFYAHKEIKDALAYLRLLVNEKDDESFLRIINYPKRGIGDTSISKLKELAYKNDTYLMNIVRNDDILIDNFKPAALRGIRAFIDLIDEMKDILNNPINRFNDALESIIRLTGIYSDLMQDKSKEGQNKRANLDELVVAFDDYLDRALQDAREPNLADYLSETSLYTDSDKDNKSDDTPKVTLMTIHASKGLEFAHVYIVGLEDNLFPSAQCLYNPKELEEERRLMYVAITRAEKGCHISYAVERFRNGRTEHSKVSRFVKELPLDLLKTFDNATLRDIAPSNKIDIAKNLSINPNPIIPKSNDSLKNIYNSGKIRVSTRAKDQEESKHNSIGELSVGDLVTHKIFGEGVIKELSGEGKDAKALVRFNDAGEKKLILSFAKLQKK